MKKNFSDFVETVKRGFQLPYIYQVVGDKILGFVQKREEELVDQTRDETPLLTALDNLPEDTITEIMSTALNMRGLSVKDALDLIPRYNGANIPLSQFLDSCTEAKSILPEEVEEDFMKFIRIRLYGVALNIARSQSFATLKGLADFFEKMFGSAKTNYDLIGELAKVRQEENESMVVYLNRLTEIEKEIRRAAEKEGRIGNEKTLTDELNQDCLRFFMRRLK